MQDTHVAISRDVRVHNAVTQALSAGGMPPPYGVRKAAAQAAIDVVDAWDATNVLKARLRDVLRLHDYCDGRCVTCKSAWPCATYQRASADRELAALIGEDA